MSNCTKCHEAGEQLSPKKCLACHTELRTRIDKRSGFHGHMAEAQRDKCEECHHEHQGRDAKLVENAEKIDHARTGWPLRGKHAAQKCGNCHEPRRIVDADAQALFKKDPRTYLGLSKRCTTCHFDEHRGQLDAACEKCHTENGWKPARLDHSTTAFPLAGRHKTVPCAKCHPTATDDKSHPAFPPPRANSFLKMSPVAHARCTDCHQDPHQGRFGANCESCHTVDGWKIIKNAAQERKFHDKTRFPLKGAHTTVACAACHGPFPGRPAKFRGLPHERCMDCHSDAHRGQLARPACERCHTVESFMPARFELEQHHETPFPLDGAHAAVPCSSCHKQDPRLAPPPSKKKHPREQPVSLISFKVKFDRCESCHQDPHAGQFSDGCVKCHSTASFTALKFDHARDSRFSLTGKHQSVACGTCHRGSPIKYKPMPLDCGGCHTDVHVGQLGRECNKCHQTSGWKPTQFNHSDPRFTTFSLDGKHKTVACGKCHKPVEVPSGRSVVKYKGLPRECEGCHVDFHHGEFKGFVP